MASRLTRAQVLTNKPTQKLEYYSDFTNSFSVFPVDGKLGRVLNDNSITQAIKNILFTNKGERPFQPTIGSEINRLLFEHNIPSNLSIVETYIKNAIELHEPRVRQFKIKAYPSDRNEHEVFVAIAYTTINSSEPVTFTVLLKRVR